MAANLNETEVRFENDFEVVDEEVPEKESGCPQVELLKHYVSYSGQKYCLECACDLDDLTDYNWLCPECQKKRERESDTMQQVLEQLKITNLKMDTLTVDIDNVNEKINQLKEVCKDNKKDTNKAIVDLQDTVKGVQSELMDTTSKLQNSLEKFSGPGDKQNELKQLMKLVQNHENDKIIELQLENSALKADMDNRLKTMEESLKMQEAQMLRFLPTSELKRLQCLVYTWTVEDIIGKLANDGSEYESPVFPLRGYNFGAKAKLVTIEESAYISLCFVDDNNKGQPIDLKVTPQVTFVLKDRSGDNGSKEDVIRKKTRVLRTNFVYGSYVYRKWLNFKLDIVKSTYKIDDSIVIDILVEPPTVAQQVYSKNGRLSWKISNYRWKKAQEEEFLVRCQNSPYFYTHPQGYRAEVELYLTGLGDYRNRGVSALVSFIPGEFDTSLPKSLPHMVSIAMVSRRYPNTYILKSQCQDLPMNGCCKIDVATHEELENDGYLLNDTLRYSIMIVPVDQLTTN